MINDASIHSWHGVANLLFSYYKNSSITKLISSLFRKVFCNFNPPDCIFAP
ncbi:Uncharacterised protein [Enterobacter cloacae]|nr:Uncharacterised protein [Enterobacter cloacae]